MTSLKAKKPADVQPGHVHCVLYGKPGVGKTWLALTFPSPYFIDTEGGANLTHYMQRLQGSGGAYLGPDAGSTDFQAVISQIQALATEKHSYRTLVIDSITKIYQLAIGKEQERLGESRDVFGAGKKPAIAGMRRLVNWIGRLDMNVIFIAHQTSEWGLVGGQRAEIGTAPDIWDKLSYEMHLVLRVEYPSRGLRTATVMKSRLTGFPEFDRLTLQDGGKDLGYTEFAARYGRDYMEAAAKPITLATAAQLSEINRLTGILKLGDDEIERVLGKAGAETYADLNTDQADKFIAWMGKKLTG